MTTSVKARNAAFKNGRVIAKKTMVKMVKKTINATRIVFICIAFRLKKNICKHN